jgi:pimeloyl-ACP methyl ester carboxylesterase
MEAVETDVLHIGYTVSGPKDGPPVLLLHGWPDSARAWVPVASRLNEAGFRTLIPWLRGFGPTRFLSAETVRDGSGVALAHDGLDLMQRLGIDRFDVVGHDWGGRTAYTMAVLFPEHVRRIVSLALAFQPRGTFALPAFSQARKHWYQWFMSLDGGPEAIRSDPKGFARIQWDTWAPPGWFDDAEFDRTAADFDNPDWVAITLNAYRRRWRSDEPSDSRYEASRAKIAATDTVDVPTLMIQGREDSCDEPASSEGLDAHFTRGYRRLVIDDVGHFPPREALDVVARAIIEHLSVT